MNLARCTALPLSLAAALAACAPPRPPLRVEAVAVGGECRLLIEGRSLTIDEIRTSARQWRGRRLRLETGPQVPYRCVGGALFALQRAGARRIGFIVRPPPGETRK